MGINISEELITPDKARKYLETMGYNRPLSHKHVNNLAFAMTEKKFYLSPHGIVFDEDGRLSDGQHRLHAIIKSNIPQRMLVCRDVPRETSNTMDRGKKRLLVDVLTYQGDTRKISNSHFGVVKFLLSINKDGKGFGHHTHPDELVFKSLNYLLPTITEVFKMTSRNHGTSKRGIYISAFFSAVLVIYLSLNDKSKLQRFCDIVCKRDIHDPNIDHWGIELREYLLNGGYAVEAGIRGGNAARVCDFNICLIAYNLYASGRKTLKKSNGGQCKRVSAFNFEIVTKDEEGYSKMNPDYQCPYDLSKLKLV